MGGMVPRHLLMYRYQIPLKVFGGMLKGRTLLKHQKFFKRVPARELVDLVLGLEVRLVGEKHLDSFLKMKE
jgi:hypothetical protein